MKEIDIGNLKKTPVNLSKEEIEATLHTIDSYKVSEQLVLEEPKFIAPPQ